MRAERNIDIVIILLNCIVNTYVYFKFLNNIYGKKYLVKYPYVIASSVFFSLNCFIAIKEIAALNILLSVVSLFTLMYYFYDFRNKNMLFKNIVFLLYCMCIEIAVFLIFSIFRYEENRFFLGGLFYIILILSTHDLLMHVLSKFKNTIVISILHILLGFTAVFEIITLMGLINLCSSENEVYLFLIALGFIVIDFGIIYLFYIFGDQAELEKELQLRKQQESLLKKYYDNIQIKYNNSRSVIHDMRKHLNILNNLGDEDSRIKDEYMKELFTQINQLGYDFECSNRILNLLLSDNILICRRKDIELILNVDDINLDFMQKTDITMLFANLLDNAVEACEEVEEGRKRIELSIRSSELYIIISLKNSSSRLPEKNAKSFRTTKRGHTGIGIQNIQSVVKKYNGDVQFKYTDFEFCSYIVFPILS